MIWTFGSCNIITNFFLLQRTKGVDGGVSAIAVLEKRPEWVTEPVCILLFMCLAGSFFGFCTRRMLAAKANS